MWLLHLMRSRLGSPINRREPFRAEELQMRTRERIYQDWPQTTAEDTVEREAFKAEHGLK